MQNEIKTRAETLFVLKSIFSATPFQPSSPTPWRNYFYNRKHSFVVVMSITNRFLLKFICNFFFFE